MPWKSKCNRWDVFALYCLHLSLLAHHLLLLQTEQLRLLLFLCKCTDAGLFSIGRLSVISYPREEHLEIVGTAPPQQLPRTWLLELSMLSVVVVVAPLLPISGCVANESLSKITHRNRYISIKQISKTTLLVEGTYLQARAGFLSYESQTEVMCLWYLSDEVGGMKNYSQVRKQQKRPK